MQGGQVYGSKKEIGTLHNDRDYPAICVTNEGAICVTNKNAHQGTNKSAHQVTNKSAHQVVTNESADYSAYSWLSFRAVSAHSLRKKKLR
jgi:hypothetical protein